MSLNGLAKKANNTASNIVNNVSKNLPKNTGSFMSASIPNIPEAINNTAKNVTEAASNAVTNAVNTVNTVATNAANSIKNSLNSDAFAGITEPIKESMNSSLESDTSPFFTIPVMIALGVLIITLILLAVFREQIAFGMSVAWEKTKKAFGGGSSTPPPPAVPDVLPNAPSIDRAAIGKMLPGKKEVFNIAVDKYTYTDAEPLCKAFGAELATYDQVKEAWNNGADWCNYGWVKGQSAVYPTQKGTYDKLQAGPEDQRMACGVPGVNGGYFDNPELRFGVNCYGSKPSESERDKRREAVKNFTPDALAYDKKVQNYKAQMDEIPVNPFKSGAWSS